MLKRTPLFAAHQKLGGRLIEFGGWEMPVQYTSIMDEHQAVRTAAGIFDISHMGEVRVSGPGALDFLNQVLTNDLRKLGPGDAQYTLMCNDQGGVVDDLYAYCIARDEFLLIVNASRIEIDLAWLQQQLPLRGKSTILENLSHDYGAVAVQGPSVHKFIDQSFQPSAQPLKVGRPSQLAKNQFDQFDFAGATVYVARTGYTGEDGFEVVAPRTVILEVWTELLRLGAPHGLKPAGLGARDTLRTEVCYPLYGHELDEETTPIEAGVGFFVALDKPDFVGKTRLTAQKSKGPSKKLVAFAMRDKSAPPRPGYPIWQAGVATGAVGKVVSGTQSPSLGIGIGLGFVPAALAKAGQEIMIEIRGKQTPATIVAKPIYRKTVDQP